MSAAAAILAVAAPGALAAITTASNTIAIAPDGIGSVNATCPATSVPLSAGFGVDGFDTVNGGILLGASKPTAGGSYARGNNLSSSAKGVLTGYAYCDTQPRNTVMRSATVALPAGVARTATASCPAGTHVISGGFSAGPAIGYRSRMVSGGWRASAFNASGSDGVTLKAFVSCQSHGPPLITRSQSRMTNPTQYHGLASVEPSCPAGTRAISGGFDGHVVTSPPSGVAPFISRRAPSAWRITGSAVSATADAQLSGFVYCEPV